jgi:hypothetical protein
MRDPAQHPPVVSIRSADPYCRPAPPAIGHNGGPHLDQSFEAYAWRRAHTKAWKSPGREIVLLRTRRAERLGLDYKAYTSVLLDRGVRLAGVVVMTDAMMATHRERVVSRFSSLGDCTIILCNSAEDKDAADVAHIPGMHIDIACRGRTQLRAVIRRAAADAQTSPGAFFMVGWREADRDWAERLGLGLFVSAFDYFGIARAGADPKDGGHTAARNLWNATEDPVAQ